jgi:hypothetical protein
LEANGTKGTMMESWTPTVSSDQTLEDATLADWIFQALGAASTCWRLPDGKRVTVGEFDSTEAKRIGDALHAHVQSVIDAVIRGTRSERDDMANEEWAHLAVDWPKKNIEELRAKLKVLTDLIGPVRHLDDEGSIIEWLRASDATVSGLITRIEALERDNKNLRYRLSEEIRIREKVIGDAFSRIVNLEAQVERISENMTTDLDQTKQRVGRLEEEVEGTDRAVAAHNDRISRLEETARRGEPIEDYSMPIGREAENARPLGKALPIRNAGRRTPWPVALRDAALRVDRYMQGSFSQATIEGVLAALRGEDVPPLRPEVKASGGVVPDENLVE